MRTFRNSPSNSIECTLFFSRTHCTSILVFISLHPLMPIKAAVFSSTLSTSIRQAKRCKGIYFVTCEMENAPNPGSSSTQFKSKLQLKKTIAHRREMEAPAHYYPIAELNQLSKIKWFTRGIVVYISPIRNGATGDHITIILKDETGCIRIFFWGEQCRTYELILEIGRVIEVEYGIIEPASEKSMPYTWVKHPFTVRFTRQSSLRIMEDPPTPFDYNFSEIDASLTLGKMIDLLGVVYSISCVEKVKTQYKRMIEVRDSEEKIAQITMWGEKAESLNREVNKIQAETNSSVILAIAGLKVHGFGKKEELNVSAFVDSIYEFNPAIAEAEQLRSWIIAEEAENKDEQQPSTDGDYGNCSLDEYEN